MEWSNKEWQCEGALSYVADTELLKSSDDFLVPTYASMFLLGDRKSAALIDFMVLWQKLRLCCGANMSPDYREWLINRDNPQYTEAAGAKICKEYNLHALEKAFRMSRVYKIASAHNKNVLKLSQQDNYFDFTYCTRAEEATIRLNLTDKDRRYRDI